LRFNKGGRVRDRGGRADPELLSIPSHNAKKNKRTNNQVSRDGLLGLELGT